MHNEVNKKDCVNKHRNSLNLAISLVKYTGYMLHQVRRNNPGRRLNHLNMVCKFLELDQLILKVITRPNKRLKVKLSRTVIA